jgi:hypothetical protein
MGGTGQRQNWYSPCFAKKSEFPFIRHGLNEGVSHFSGLTPSRGQAELWAERVTVTWVSFDHAKLNKVRETGREGRSAGVGGGQKRRLSTRKP